MKFAFNESFSTVAMEGGNIQTGKVIPPIFPYTLAHCKTSSGGTSMGEHPDPPLPKGRISEFACKHLPSPLGGAPGFFCRPFSSDPSSGKRHLQASFPRGRGRVLVGRRSLRGATHGAPLSNPPSQSPPEWEPCTCHQSTSLAKNGSCGKSSNFRQKFMGDRGWGRTRVGTWGGGDMGGHKGNMDLWGPVATRML